MRLLLWLLRLYPPAFRAQFETEMIETLSEAQGQTLPHRRLAFLAFWIREAAGIVRGVARERLAAGVDQSGHWASAVAVAMAVQCLAYGALLPVGPSGIASTGAGLYRLGAVFIGIAVAIEVSRAIIAAGRKQRRIR